MNYSAFFCEDFLILVSRAFGLKFFAGNGEIGEINTDILKLVSFYIEKGSLFLEGDLDFCLKLKKNINLPKINKKPKNFYADSEFYYYEFKNISSVKITFAKTGFCLDKAGCESLNKLLTGVNQKPLTTANHKQRNVIVGYEIKTEADFSKFTGVFTLAQMFSKFGFNFVIKPIILNLSLKEKQKFSQRKAKPAGLPVHDDKINYLLNNLNNIKTEFINKQDMFCISLPHHIFKITLNSGVLSIAGGGIKCKIQNAQHKIREYKFIENTLVLKKEIYFATLDNGVCINTANITNVYKTIFDWQNDFFYLFKQLESGDLTLNDEILNKMLASVKTHIKERTNTKLLSKQLFCLCGYVTEEKKKTGLLRLATLVGRLTQKGSERRKESLQKT